MVPFNTGHFSWYAPLTTPSSTKNRRSRFVDPDIHCRTLPLHSPSYSPTHADPAIRSGIAIIRAKDVAHDPDPTPVSAKGGSSTEEEGLKISGFLQAFDTRQYGHALVVNLLPPLRCEGLGCADLSGSNSFFYNIQIARRLLVTLRLGK